MRKHLLTLTLVLLAVQMGWAQYAARESFEYKQGDSLAAATGISANGWSGSWAFDRDTPGFMSIGTAPLAYGDLNFVIRNIGNHVTVSNPGGWAASRYARPLSQNWPDVAGNTYWTSFIFEAKRTPTGNTYYLVKLFSGSTEVLAIGKGGGGVNYSCGSGWPGGAGDDYSSVACENVPVWLVTKTVMSGNSGSERTYMWIDPDPNAGEPDTNNAAVKRWTPMNDGFNRVLIECGGEDSMKTNWDEIRLGTTWASVSQSLPWKVRESFDYSLDATLDTLIGGYNNGFAGDWDNIEGTLGTIKIADNAFNYSDLNYPVPHTAKHVSGINSGGAWSYQRTGRYLSEKAPDAAGKVYWLTFLMEMRGSWTANSWAGVGLYDSTSEQALFGKGWGSTLYSIGSSADQGRTTSGWDSGPQWVVAKVVMSGDTTEEKLYMWLSPDPNAGEPDTATADGKAIQKLNNGFNRIVYHFGGELPEEVLSVDEIRLGENWTDVSDVYLSVFKEFVSAKNFALEQNYPNPFNPATKISYTLKNAGNVRLTVYDMLGKEVKQLVVGYQNAGTHTVDFNAANLTSGVYLYRLQNGNEFLTKKMILVK